MNSKEYSEETYIETILKSPIFHKNSSNSLEQKEKFEVQKNRFNTISDLVSKLFQHKNSKESYKSISNLILLQLGQNLEEDPVDVFTGRNADDLYTEYNKEYNDILMREFDKAVQEFSNTIRIGKKFLEVLQRFNGQFDVVNNVMYCPKINGNSNGKKPLN